jgi:hypothetical protein
MDGYRVAIIGTDTLPLPLREGHPEEIWVEDKNSQGRLVNFKDRFSRATGLGNRVWNIATQLAMRDIDVTVFVPKHTLPSTPEFIDVENIPFIIEGYDLTLVNFQYSDDFQRVLTQFNTVIVQPGGIALWNCIHLPSNIHLILDGYIPVLAEQPNWISSITKDHLGCTRQYVYNRFLDIHNKLMNRVDAICYANNNQLHYYEGQLLLLGRIDLDTAKINVPLIKVPMGVDSVKLVTKKKTDVSTLKLLWYGGVYQWFDPEFILDTLGNQPGISVDFCGLKHPRFISSEIGADSTAKKISGYDNMRLLDTGYIEDPSELFSQYDAGIIISKEGPEQHYAHRSRILEMLRYGLPVITDECCDFANEYKLQNVYTLARGKFLSNINILKILSLNFDQAYDIDIINQKFLWPKATNKLVSYIKLRSLQRSELLTLR